MGAYHRYGTLLFEAMVVHCLLLLLLLLCPYHSLGKVVRDKNSGPHSIDMRVELEVEEGVPVGSFVGRIPTKPGFTYRFNEHMDYFVMNGTTGEVRTKKEIDREKLQHNQFDIVVLSSQPTYPIEVRISIKDVNDCSPVFPEPEVSLTFPESAIAGTRVFLDTAEDEDSPPNGVQTGYKIVSGNEDGHFRLVVTTTPSGEVPFLHLETTGKLDRETRPFYHLNISAQDGGLPPKFGYLGVNVTISDVNDCQPAFAQSQYNALLNESAEVGSVVLQVSATDNDEGENARVSYYLSETEEQFTIEPETGVIKTVQPLNCPKNCAQTQNSQQKCSKTCVFTVFSRDHGTPRQDGRTSVTVTLIESNHPPIIKFRYFPPTARTAVVIESALNATVVAAISVIDMDEGANGETVVNIVKGNELKHFTLESTPSFQLVRTNAILDREKVAFYNLTITARDNGNPPRSSTAFLIIEVNNDKDPVISFAKTEYSAVLRESDPVGSYVASITATDETTSSKSQVFYSIVSGNERQWFQIDSATGLLTSRAPLDREQQGIVRLKISARDGGPYPKWAHAQIKITILDENDETPQFENPLLNVTLSEDASPGSEVITVSAVDHDQGTNGTITYKLSEETELIYPNQFQIDPSSGKVISKSKFDREKTDRYDIKIIASDHGSPSLSSTATVHLHIEDVNDNIPVFYPLEYYFTISLDSKVGDLVGKVVATDLDSGDDGKVKYKLISSSQANLFSVDESSGVIILKDRVKSNKRESLFMLQVSASDGSGVTSDNDAMIHINLVKSKSVLHHHSKCSDQLTFSIAEDFGTAATSGSRYVGKVSVEDGSGGGGELRFILVDGDPNGIFTLDERNGVITKTKRLDREEKASYTLKVVAKKEDNTFTSCLVTVDVTDLNDQVPTWDYSVAEVHIDKNAPVGEELVVVKATDLDEGLNSKLSYSLTSNPFDLCKIDQSNGLITLDKSIRSVVNMSKIVLEITAKDSGVQPLVSKRTLTVHLRDVNEHSPTFDHMSYETSLLESILVNTRFFTLKATDKDVGLNAEVNYDIAADGNSLDKFGIFPDGNLYVKSHLDREEQDYFSLTVVARDNGVPPRSSVTSFVVHVIDENDMTPKFSSSSYAFTIDENEPSGTFVGKVSATDGDIGRNAELAYHFTASQSDFSIDHKNGFIQTLRPFDREYLIQIQGHSVITLEVTVHDNGVKKLSDKATVEIKINDVNDVTPKFSRESYNVQISEDASVGASIIRVMAVDSDDQLNGDIFYSLESGDDDEIFHLDGATGHISLRKKLDRETRDKYVLSVRAQDMSDTSPLSSLASVLISILDANDCAPEFKAPVLRLDGGSHASLDKPQSNTDNFRILETTPVNTELVKFIATDKDLRQNGEVAYSITGGNRHDTFRVNAKNGILHLNKALDYEKTSKYMLTLTASDSGSPRLSSSIDFIVEVEDVNDCAPQFPSTSVVRQIQEGIPLKSPIVTVSAEDADSGDNSKIRYSIKSQTPPGTHFGIDSATGTIHTLLPIDREITDTFRLVVVAEDQAQPPSTRLSSEKLVTIIVEDVNDCEPRFTCLNAALLRANSGAMTEIMRVSAVDLDSESNGVVTFELIGGDLTLFELNRVTGSLVLRRPVAQVQPRYQLTVRATDEAIQSQRKSSDLQLMVLGVSDNSGSSGLHFEQEKFEASIYENEPVGSSLLTVTATLASSSVKSESVASVEYYITNITSPDGRLQNRLFDIDVKRGIVSTAEVLDREMGVWNFNVDIYAVFVSTTGLYTASSQVRIEVLDVNDTPPKWSQPDGFWLNISENAPVGQEVSYLAATDEDTTGKISYSIVNGDEGKFLLDTKTGALKIIDALDRETQEVWNLIVRASDGEQYSDTTVTITVTDTNDNPPSWEQTAYSFDVEEDASPGYVVGTLHAVDLDKDVNGRIVYSILSDWGDDIFSLNPSTGAMKLTGKLDYEVVQHYIFVVQAQDTGTPSLSSTTTVYLNVLDLNDNAPVFDPVSYSAEVAENVPVGSVVLSVVASDMDSGENGKIFYSIVSGNTDNVFTIAQNGSIITVKPLDRESTSSYQLTVQAADQAKTNQLSSSVQVSIVLKDVNDVAPEFTSSDFAKIPENSPINSVVIVIKAVDRDEGRNGYVEYTLHNEKSTFNLGSVDGLLRVIGNIDREDVSNYTLKITARDRGDPSLSTTQELFVKVQDRNDHGPKFDTHQYTAEVPENAIIGTNVLQVNAFDMDEGPNSQIRYSIIGGDPNGDFSVGEDSGMLRVARGLNYERKKLYVLTINAEDLAEDSRYDTATVTIIIADVNDRSPIFLDSPYIAFVKENMVQVPQTVVRVNAYDADSFSKNLQVRYRIKDGDREAFRVNDTTGEVTVHRALDREKQSKYLLTIVAIDTGTPRLTGTGMIEVHVRDQNDCNPTFEHDSYELFVPENTPSKTRVSRVHADDKDEGLNSVVRYRLQSAFPVPYEIDPVRGEIYTSGLLDRETKEQYQFHVVATDSSKIFQRSSTAEVTVTLVDVNDNFPKFNQAVYSVHIPNNLPSGSYVFGASATDSDSGLNGEIRYYLGGPDADKFQLNETTGVLKSIPALLKSGKSNLALEVRAVDSSPKDPLSSTASVKITLSEHGRFPKIRPVTQQFSLWENATTGTAIMTVEAFGTNMGNSGQLEYFIGGGNIGNAFVIDRHSGQLSISPIGLDYEVCQHYELWVEVGDRGEPEYRSAVPIHIHIKDVNDNGPIFETKHYNVSIPEEEQPPKLLTTIRATDKDSGLNGAITYSFQEETLRKYSKMFELNAETGEIFCKTKLDREEQSMFVLKVAAVDLGEPSQSGTATVTVNVQDINDNPMKFTRLFNVNVTENSPIGTFVVQVTSADRDEASNCTYRFTDNNSGKFKIDPYSGNVTVNGSLDRELVDEYQLKVSAFDGSWKAETSVTITIEDVNDVAPEFEAKSYSFNIPESENSVSFVGQVSAIDHDKRGPNSLVTYSMRHQSDYFSVDPASGDIFTKKAIHYKQITSRFSPENEYILGIVAVDSGKPPLSSEVMVTINVVNSNNHPPEFSNDEFFSPVLYNMLPGSRIIKLHANDPIDLGLNSEIEYLKIGGNGSELFEIEKQTGWIVLAGDVNKLVKRSFQLHARALDKGIPPLSDDAMITLTITESNDHSPVFSSLSYRVIVSENEGLGTSIVTLFATDEDTGPNAKITYNISRGNEQQKFTINPVSGAVSINKELDYDTKKEYLLIISATDNGFQPRSGEAELIVTLTDVNDNPPYFEEKVYRAYIKENEPLRTEIFTLAAKDKDSPKNGVIRYAIVGGSGKHAFSVDPVTGIIVSTQSFDYEAKTEYVLDIMATNPDSNLHGTCKVEVQIIGVNEFIPHFVQPVFHFSVSESAVIGHYVGSIQATDDDSGEDGIVYYILVGASNDRGFMFNAETGAITVAKRLDRESQSRVVLTALAKNRGSIRGNDTDEAQIVINVQDGNDPPVFEKSEYITAIKEDVPVGTSIVTVLAHDIDVRPSNNRFTYEILSEAHNHTFRIDPISGTVYTMGLLDRETLPHYTLVLGAVDTGVPPGVGKTVVKINLLDVNDSPPRLASSSKFGEILENAPGNTKVMTLQAIDEDISPNGEPFTFTLMSGKDSSKFKVDPRTGNVYTTASFDREVTPEFTITVEIADNGTPPLRSREEIKIVVKDINDSPSQPRNAEILIFMRHMMPHLEKVAPIPPIDPDTTGKYTCRLEDGGDNFLIPSKCDLHVQRFPPDNKQDLTIISDDGRHAEVVSKMQTRFTFYDEATIKNSIIIRAFGLEPSRFLRNSYKKFVSFLKSVFHTTPIVYSLIPYENGTNVVVAILASSQGYLNPVDVTSSLNSRKSEVESVFGTTVVINFSPCSMESVCQNGGTCSHSLSLQSGQVSTDTSSLILSAPKFQLRTTCTCSPMWTGMNCQHQKEPCVPNPCHEGGTCLKQAYDFTCICPPHRQGKRCDMEKDNACKINPCLNGGTCKENHNDQGHFCLCRPGFFGDLCQTASNVCKPNPCLNGGECVAPMGSLSSFPKCRCRAHYFGRYCEKSAFGFGPGSFMSFPPLEPNTNDISIIFSTNKRNSLLVYDFGEQTGGRSDFVALQILDGKPTLSYGGARTAVSSISVNKFVTDGNWHRIIATRNSKAVSLYVSTCEQGGEICEECKPGNPACYANGAGMSGTLNFNSFPVLIGGVKDIETVLSRPGQIQTDDFVGCVHSIAVNGRFLNMTTPLEARAISEECHRVEDVCETSGYNCGSGRCLDLWDSYACDCNGIVASNCHDAFAPYSFSSGTFVEYRIGEKYKRSQILPSQVSSFASNIRRKRDLMKKSLSFSFRTIQKDAILLYATSEQDYTLVELDGGEVHFSTKVGNNPHIELKMPGIFASDGNWHTFRLVAENRALSVWVDDLVFGEELDAVSSHDFLDPYLTDLTLGGAMDSTPTNRILNGFTGCMANFTINNENQPLSGFGGVFDEIVVHGKLSKGCNSAVTGAVTSPDPLSIGVTLVIVFFVLLLVAISVSFVVFRMRKREKNAMASSSKPPPAVQSPGDVVRNPMLDDDSEAIRNFVRNSKKMGPNNTCYQKPDIIERTAATPPQLMPSSSPISNCMISQNPISLEPELPDMPEHYDLENASSIAPSDIDIVYHYKGFRDNLGHKSSPFRHNHLFFNNLPGSGGIRQSPISNVLKSTPLARLSPSSELSQQITPRILTLQDISGKPLQSALLASTQKDAMSQSERSLNISRSSSRSSMVNASSQGTKKRKKKCGEGGSTMNIGLTAEEIQRLNSPRHKNNSSLVSTLDDLSSESEDHRKNNLSNLLERKGERRPRPRGRHTSSDEDESGNDSFSCSEFEYNNEKRNGFRHPHPHDSQQHLMFSKHVHGGGVGGPAEGEGSYHGSLSTLVASDDDLAYISNFAKTHSHPSGASASMRWDYLLNWGPSFDNLSNVFKDIAQLPNLSSAGDVAPNSSSQSTAINLGNSGPISISRSNNRYPTPRPSEEYV